MNFPGQKLWNKYLNLDEKSLMFMKITFLTVGLVYGGHKLVQFVSPTKEELLKVFQHSQCFLIFYRDFLKSVEIII